MLLKDICPSFSCPSCKKWLNILDLRTFVAKFCRKNLRIFSADFFDLKSKIRRHFYFLDVCLSSTVFVFFVYLCMRHVMISVLISLDQELSENVWFVWPKTSYSEDKWRCHIAGRTTTREDSATRLLICELLSLATKLCSLEFGFLLRFSCAEQLAGWQLVKVKLNKLAKAWKMR